MTTTLEFTGTDAEGHKHLRAIEDAVMPALASGKITAKINGKPVVIHTADTSHGHSEFHPTDAKQDKHHQHTGGRRPDAPVSVTFLDAP